MQYKVEMIVDVPDYDQKIVTTMIPRAITERFRGTQVSILEIKVQKIQEEAPSQE